MLFHLRHGPWRKKLQQVSWNCWFKWQTADHCHFYCCHDWCHPPTSNFYTRKRDHCHPSYPFPPQFDIWHTPIHWANTDMTLHLISYVVVPYINAVRERIPTLLLPSQGSTQLLSDNNISQCKYHLTNCTCWLQPLDISVNKAVKENLCKSLNIWYAEQVQQQLAKCWYEVFCLEAKWVASCYDYLQNNKQIVFKEAGIVDALKTALTTQTIDDENSFEGLVMKTKNV